MYIWVLDFRQVLGAVFLEYGVKAVANIWQLAFLLLHVRNVFEPRRGECLGWAPQQKESY